MTAEDRVWEVVRRAFEEREPGARRPPRRRLAVALLLTTATATAIVLAALSPPGHAVFERVRRAVGVEHAAPALLSLPAPGRLLVVSAEGGGTWIVDADGSRRRLGDFTDAEWSPHGLYVVATERDELIALDPHGRVRWKLTRRNVAWPSWEGTRTDTRIAYFAQSGLHVVAGDGTGDHLLDAYAYAGALSWDPARRHTLAYAVGGAVVLRNVDNGHILWRRPVTILPASLTWSSDGRRLAVASGHEVIVLDAEGRVIRFARESATVTGAAFRPGTHRLALVLEYPGPPRRSEVRALDADRRGPQSLLFAGAGEFGDIAWDPGGRWLLVDWRTANQWLFLRGSHVHAVANIAQQFPRPDRRPPLLEVDGRWCCPP